MIGGIYRIKNLTTNKIYIGSAKSFYNRFKEHKSLLRRSKHENGRLQNAWNKYGEQSFVFEILEYCEPDKLIEREQLYIDWFKCCDREIGFNLKPSAQNSLGYKHTEEAKAKIKANSIRLGCRPPSPLGRKHSEETKLKQSLAKKGKKRKFKVKRKPHSEETKNKIRLAHLGKKLSEETKNKIIKSLIGNQRGKKKNEPSRPSPG